MSRMLNAKMVEDVAAFAEVNSDLLLVDLSRVDANSAVELRRKLRSAGVQLLGARSALVRIALKRKFGDGVGAGIAGAITLVGGSEDVVSLAKVVSQSVSGNEKAKIVGGVVEGQLVGADSVDALSKSPGRAELLASISGSISGVGGQVAAAIQSVGEALAGACDSIASV